jgi:hypothetical protein
MDMTPEQFEPCNFAFRSILMGEYMKRVEFQIIEYRSITGKFSTGI